MVRGLECKGIKSWSYKDNVSGVTYFALDYLEFETIWDTKYDDFWINSENQTISISSKLSEVENGEEFLTWLRANAVKQDS